MVYGTSGSATDERPRDSSAGWPELQPEFAKPGLRSNFGSIHESNLGELEHQASAQSFFGTADRETLGLILHLEYASAVVYGNTF